MGRFGAENIFEANKMSYYFARLINFESVTIVRSKDSTFKAYTSKLDVTKFIVGVFICLYCFFEVAMVPIQVESRSIVFELTMSLYGKIQCFTPTITMIWLFFNRHEYFRILKILHWMDIKVIIIEVIKNVKINLI